MMKALTYLFFKNKKLFLQVGLRNPFTYFYRYLTSFLFFKKRRKVEDFYLFGIEKLTDLEKLIQDPKNILIVGLSYCQKPLDCPVRFSDKCLFCGKCLLSQFKTKKKNNLFCFPISTVGDLGEKIANLIKNKEKGSSLIFILTACDLAISLFERFSYVLDLKGLAFPLKGSVCLDFKNFYEAEKGNKNNSTYLSPSNEYLMKKLIELRKENFYFS